MLKIKKIFYTLQAEGTHSGLPSIFIRFAGCNLSCDFCDTDFADGQRMSIDEILCAIKSYPCKNVVITGGEPTAQLLGLSDLIDALLVEKYFVMIETNGTGVIPKAREVFITVSPKDQVRHMSIADATRSKKIVQKIVGDLKVVYQGQSIEQLNEIGNRYLVASRRYLQPCSMDVQPVIDIIKSMPGWYLSFQWHKTVGIE